VAVGKASAISVVTTGMPVSLAEHPESMGSPALSVVRHRFASALAAGLRGPAGGPADPFFCCAAGPSGGKLGQA
jgi:hypothetical protein